MEKKVLDFVFTKFNESANKVLDRYAGKPEIKDFAITVELDNDNGIYVYPTHSQVFYSSEDFLRLPLALDIQFYWALRKNHDGVDTISLHVF